MQHVQRSRPDVGVGEAGVEEDSGGVEEDSGVVDVDVGVVGSEETEEAQLKIERRTMNRMRLVPRHRSLDRFSVEDRPRGRFRGDEGQAEAHSRRRGVEIEVEDRDQRVETPVARY